MIDEIKFKTMAEEIIKLDLGNLNCVGIRCKDCIYNIEHNSCMCLRGYIKIAIEKSEELLNKLEKEDK